MQGCPLQQPAHPSTHPPLLPRSMRAGKPPGGVPGGAPVPEGPKDPPQLVESVMRLFDRWARLLEEAPQEKVHAPFVQELQQAGFLKVGAAGWGGAAGREDRSGGGSLVRAGMWARRLQACCVPCPRTRPRSAHLQLPAPAPPRAGRRDDRALPAHHDPAGGAALPAQRGGSRRQPAARRATPRRAVLHRGGCRCAPLCVPHHPARRRQLAVCQGAAVGGCVRGGWEWWEGGAGGSGW